MAATYNPGDRVKVHGYPWSEGHDEPDPNGLEGTVTGDDGFYVNVELDGEITPGDGEPDWLFTADELSPLVTA